MGMNNVLDLENSEISALIFYGLWWELTLPNIVVIYISITNSILNYENITKFHK